MPNFLTRWFRATPEFTLYDDFTPAQFEYEKIWLDVHLNDHGNAKYEHVDAGTFRRWDRPYPSSGDFEGLVATRFTTSEGGKLFGYITNSQHDYGECTDPLIIYTPRIFTDEGPVSFWHGAVYQFGTKFLDMDIQTLMKHSKAELGAVFPIEYTTEDGALSIPITGQIEGFGFYSGENTVHHTLDTA